MDLPGLKESLKELKLIGDVTVYKIKGGDMEKPKEAKIEIFNPLDKELHSESAPSDFILRRDFANQVISIQEKFMKLCEENDDLRAENQRLRTERIKILEIMGGK